MAPKVIIIILNWNQKDDTITCLNSLKKLEYPNYKIILIDNASTDNSYTVIRRAFPSIEIIRNEENLGVTRGRNLGIKYAISSSADYILFLDNDTTVYKDMLTKLVEAGEKDPRIGILTSKIYFFANKNRIWALGGNVNFFTGNISLKGYNEIDHGQYDSFPIIQVDHVPGCCLMIKSNVIKKIGNFDTRFYSGQDTEMCIRALMTGYRLVAVPPSKMSHKDTQSWAKQSLHYMRGKSITLLMRKYAKLYHWIFFAPYSFFASIKILLTHGKGTEFKNLLSKIKGFTKTIKF
jgi:GT2 family glycosyltransferase